MRTKGLSSLVTANDDVVEETPSKNYGTVRHDVGISKKRGQISRL
jgi:hypothetical protein